MRELKELDVLTPLAACVLFGKSGEAVRRAVKGRLVKSHMVLPFGTKQTIPLIDLDSARRYWVRHPRPAYLPNLEAEIDEMRRHGMTIGKSRATTHYRILHPYELMEWHETAVDQVHYED